MNASSWWLKYLSFAVFAGGLIFVGSDLARSFPRYGETTAGGFIVHASVALVFGWMVLRYLRTAKDAL